MKIHSDSRRKFPDGLKEFPTDLMSEGMALKNHSQTLSRLNERGGMGYREIICNIFGLELGWIFKKPGTQKQVDLLTDIIKVINGE